MDFNSKAPNLKDLGIPQNVTNQQEEIILKPFISMDKFTGGGALNKKRAVKFWIKTLQDFGASPLVLEKTKEVWDKTLS